MNAVTPVQEVIMNLNNMKGEFKSALPSHIDVAKFIRVARTAISNNTDLLNANRTSLYAACMKAAQDGLMPDGREAALVKFKDSVAYMPMVSGILKLVRNSNEIATLTSQIVHEKDVFKYWVDADGEHLLHEPQIMNPDRGGIIGAYALAKTKQGEIYVEVMSLPQLEAVKNSSRSRDSGPWAGPFKTEMYRKTVIRRLAKRLPLSTDREEDEQFERVIHADNDLFMPEENKVDIKKVEAVETKKGTKRLSSLIETTSTEAPVDTSDANEPEVL